MTLENLSQLLKSIKGFKDRVAYRMFPEGEGVGFPFVTYLVTDTNNFMADGIVYKQILEVDIELYTKFKDIKTEHLLENALKDNEIAWEKNETYLRDELCYMIVYTINIEGE